MLFAYPYIIHHTCVHWRSQYGGKGSRVPPPPLTAEKIAKNRGKEGKIKKKSGKEGENQEKIGKKRKNREEKVKIGKVLSLCPS